MAAVIGLLGVLYYLVSPSVGPYALFLSKVIIPSEPGLALEMAFNSGLNLFLLGTGLLFLDTKISRNYWLGELLVSLSVLLNLDAAVGEALNPFGAMASLSTATFLLLCAGILASRPKHGILSTLTSTGPGGLLARRLLLPTLFLPPAFARILLTVQVTQDLGTRASFSILMLSILVPLAVLVLNYARLEDRVEEERKRAEKELHDTNTKLKALVNASPVALVWYGLDESILLWNPAAERMFGWSEQEVLGRSYSDVLIPEEKEEEHRALCQAIVEGEAPYHLVTRRLRKNGSLLDVIGSRAPLHDERGNLFGTIAILMDITERERARNALMESQQRLDLALRASNTGLWDWDLRTNQVHFSQEWKSQIGYAENEIGDGYEEWESRLHPEDRERTMAAVRRHFANQEEEYKVEFRLRHKDGSYRWIQAQGLVLKDSQGKLYRMVGSHLDISARRNLEEQLLQAQKMEAVGQLAGGIAHDFNNLLGVMLGYSDLLLEGVKQSDPAYKRIEQIRKAADRGIALTRQLLAFSRKQVLEPKILNLNSLVAEEEQLLRRLIGEHIELMMQLDPSLGPVKADPNKIEQVLMNLAINARDAMPKGGKLVIETAHAELDEAYVRNHHGTRPGSYVMVAVSDTGIGMDTETARRIFEPFFTTKESGKGTGLGLSTVYGIVRQSGGFIWVYSELGKGTTFKIYLPRVDETGETLSETKSIAASLRGQETVLVVEDDASLRQLTCEFLKSSGYRVLAAKDGSEALAIARQSATPVHVLVTDMVMPGIGGEELARQVASIHPSIKVLCTSGYTAFDMAHHGVPQPQTAFLEKPLFKEKLLQKIRDLLDE